MILKTKSIYLSIGGFTFRIHLHNSNRPFDSSILVKTILTNFNGFISSPKKHDITLEIVDMVSPHYYIDSSTSIKYGPLYQKISPKKILVYSAISFAQFQVVLIDIINQFSQTYPVFLLHASAVCGPKGALIFAGDEGVGKSTLMRSLGRGGFVPLADDTVLIRKVGSKFLLFQTPLVEKEYSILKKKDSYPIFRLYILQRGQRFLANKIENKSESLIKLAKHLWSRWELPIVKSKQLQALTLYLKTSHPISKLSCCLNPKERNLFFQDL